ncbi:hypothetical protein PSC71_00080 [Devosia sp. J2-20]|uniref:hypothetical protein n=1 Tax=Devosia sp. J2-20 TaxID=3026161 RepID=UPI00249B6168|nr:hypothetical protein [Devosia sp. J2-20]WDQ99249.1 hypothetical protein PSC71_00080 [Devosia sp. J2-20]
MNDTAAGANQTMPPAIRRQNALTLLLVLGTALALAVRINISPMMMNQVMDYTEEGGAFYEKLHFGTYMILLMLPITLFSQPIRLWGDEIDRFKVLIWYCLAMLAFVVLLFITGRPGSSVFIIDTYLVAGAAGLIALALGGCEASSG